MVEAFKTGQEGSFDVREKKEGARAGLASGRAQEKFGASWSLPAATATSLSIKIVGLFRSSGSFRHPPHAPAILPRFTGCQKARPGASPKDKKAAFLPTSLPEIVSQSLQTNQYLLNHHP